MAEETNNSINKKPWSHKWWGVLFLTVLSVGFLFVGAFIYQVVFLLDAQSQYLAGAQELANLDSASAASLRELLEIKEAPSSGSANPALVIVEFSDYQCPFSKEAYPIIKMIGEQYPDLLKIIYRDFPNLTNHPDAMNAALAVNCANEQNKFKEYHDLLFENQANLSTDNLKSLAAQIGINSTQFDSCLDTKKYAAKIQNDLQAGLKFGITGTPTFFLNGMKVAGVIPYDSLKEIMEALKQAVAAN